MESYNLDIINIVSVKTMEVSDENGTNLSRNNLTNEGSGGSGTFTFQLFSLLLANSNIKISFLQIICRMKQYK